MGVLLAFLFFNFNPARIFMGDSGSYLLGYVLATTSLTGALQQKASTAVSLLVPVIALGVPIFDTLFSMIRRFLERRPIFSPDRGHVHHRLLDLGLTHRRAVMLLYGVSVAFAACAIALSLGRSWETGFALLSASIVVFALLRYTGYSEYLHRGRNRAPVYDETTERLRRVIPRALGSLDNAHSEDEALRNLFLAMRHAGLAAVELRSSDGAIIQHSGQAPADAFSGLRSTYPIGEKPRARLDFVWGPDCEALTQSTGILLQLVVDAMSACLQACASPLAPAPESVAPQPFEPSVPLPSSSQA
jgi:UDP-GlcNAc:undecaprenyl-phosphate GlcNAc-1-phosphate transferase